MLKKITLIKNSSLYINPNLKDYDYDGWFTEEEKLDDFPTLEADEEELKGLKTLTANKLLIRLSILSAQIKEIIQILSFV